MRSLGRRRRVGSPAATASSPAAALDAGDVSADEEAGVDVGVDDEAGAGAGEAAAAKRRRAASAHTPPRGTALTARRRLAAIVARGAQDEEDRVCGQQARKARKGWKGS